MRPARVVRLMRHGDGKVGADDAVVHATRGLVVGRRVLGVERRLDGGVVGDVGLNHGRVARQAFNQRTNTALQGFILIGKSQLGALCGQLLGNAQIQISKACPVV